MTRQDVLKEYQIDQGGKIANKGKFEGEKLYVPYFFDLVMNGHFTEAYSSLDIIEVSEDDRKEFPELKDVYSVVLKHSENGFVYGFEMSESDLKDLRNELEANEEQN